VLLVKSQDTLRLADVVRAIRCRGRRRRRKCRALFAAALRYCAMMLPVLPSLSMAPMPFNLWA